MYAIKEQGDTKEETIDGGIVDGGFSIVSLSEEVLGLIGIENVLVKWFFSGIKHFRQWTNYVARSWIDKYGNGDYVSTPICHPSVLQAFVSAIAHDLQCISHADHDGTLFTLLAIYLLFFCCFLLHISKSNSNIQKNKK